MRPGRTAAGAVAEAGGVPRDGQRSQQERVEHERRVTLVARQHPQPAHQQQVLLDRGLEILARQPVGSLQHRGARGVGAVVGADDRTEQRSGRRQRLGLGDDVKGATLGQLQVDVVEGLQAGTELRRRAAHPSGHRPDASVPVAQHGDDAVGLAKLWVRSTTASSR